MRGACRLSCMGRVLLRAVSTSATVLGLILGLVAAPVGATTLLSPTGAPEAPGMLAPTTSTSSPQPAKALAKGQAKNHAKNGGAARQPVRLFIEPASAVASLIANVTSDERQLLGLKAYLDAQAYLGKAQGGLDAATSSLAHATTAVALAGAAEARAIRAEQAGEQKVELDLSALRELGVAEYTGQAAITGTDLASQEREIQFSELTKVASVDESSLYRAAQDVLGADVRRVHARRLVLTSALHVEARAKSTLSAARAQLARSEAALLDARTWATVPGEGPSRPGRALVVLEVGPAAAQRHRSGDGNGKSPPRRLLVAGAMQVPVQARLPAGPSHAAGRANAGGPSILGSPVLSAAEMAGWFASTGAVAGTAVPVSQLASDYIAAGKLTGVRGDVAFAQSVLETGYFSFPANGQDPAAYNNFAGIGACNSCKHGWKFSSASAGVLAQERLLREYAGNFSGSGVKQGPNEPVKRSVTSGCCQTWMALSGVWASNPNYGYEILSVYKEMLDWVVGQDLQTTGLVPAQALGPRILRGGAA